MEINLGPCHYDGGDDATMTAVHPDRIGWIAVCRGHAGKAKQEGYRVNEVGGRRGPTSPHPAEPGTARPPGGLAEAKGGATGGVGVDGERIDRHGDERDPYRDERDPYRDECKACGDERDPYRDECEACGDEGDLDVLDRILGRFPADG